MRDGDIKERKNELLLTLLPCSRSKYINNRNESALCAILECFPDSRLLSKTDLYHSKCANNLAQESEIHRSSQRCEVARCFSQRVTLKQYSADDGEREGVKDVKDGAKIPS